MIWLCISVKYDYSLGSIKKTPAKTWNPIILYSLYRYNEQNIFHAKTLSTPVCDKIEQNGTTNRQRKKNENKPAIFMKTINQTNTKILF